jgi:hypothetical protein
MFLLSPWPWLDGALAADAAWLDGATISDGAWLDSDDAIPLVLLPYLPDSTSGDDGANVDDNAPMPMVRNGGARRPRRRHPGVMFAVNDTNRTEHVFKTFDEAAAFAVGLARSNGTRVYLDVLVYSPAGAAWWAGDDAAADYFDDPDTSVFERIEIHADSLGSVP